MRSAVFAITLALAVTASTSAPVAATSPTFLSWTQSFGRTYSPEEATMREAIFGANLAVIEAHNADPTQTFTMAANAFVDLTSKEFAAAHVNGYKPRSMRRAKRLASLPAAPLPSSVDWIAKGAVTAVGNEGQCGSCWAFSTVDAVSAEWFIAGHKLIELSVQQLVDCSSSEGNAGCNGGLMDDAFEYIIKNKGICSAAAYPYTATGPNTCKKCTPVATIKSYVDVQPKNATALQEAVVLGVVAVGVEAGQQPFQFYSSGVITAGCGAQVDHSLAVVGYGGGESGTPEYWHAKNLWGASWGEHGFVRIGRGKGQSGDGANDGQGMCGILTESSYPVV